MSEPDIPEGYKKYSAAQLRTMLGTGQIATSFIPQVNAWLSYQDRLAEESNRTTMAEQIEIARSASEAASRAADAAERQAVAAERANTRATIALVIAIVSIIATAAVTIIGIWVVHFDATRPH